MSDNTPRTRATMDPGSHLLPQRSSVSVSDAINEFDAAQSAMREALVKVLEATRQPEPAMLTVREFSQRIGITQRHCWNLISDGRIESHKVGNARRIPISELHRVVRGGAS